MKKRIITAYVMTLVCMCLLSFYASASSFMNDSSITIKDEYQYNDYFTKHISSLNSAVYTMRSPYIVEEANIRNVEVQVNSNAKVNLTLQLTNSEGVSESIDIKRSGTFYISGKLVGKNAKGAWKISVISKGYGFGYGNNGNGNINIKVNYNVSSTWR